ncbi:hypothetical protein JHK82_046323 [Glycine max]|nr:hypothetical protein JHK86_046221 [Glycine max]KAG5096469.1 hypothetical protein JHK82_046323 [Glycine max]KAG5101264.1 hypothetical protein JHK84_046233 [Glycine max]
MKRGRRKEERQAQKHEKVILPQEMVNQILLRLPVKSLLQFKTVCKSWLSHISDPHFAISHFDLAAARTERIALLVPFDREFLSIDFDASLASNALNLDPLLASKSFSLVILGSCRGFLLLICGHRLYVWNPSTDDYLVVLASYNRNFPQDELVTHFEYFSLRANTWKATDGTGTSSQSALQQVVILSEKISELDWLNVVARDTCENIGLILMVNVDMKWPCIQSLYFHSLVIASRANKRKKMTNNSKLEELRVKSGCDLSVRRGVQ